MNKTIGYLVIDSAEEWEQPLRLRHADGDPPAGVLEWLGKGDAASVFPDRKAARAAINRTHHFAHALEQVGLYPTKVACKIVPLRMA